MSRPHSAMSSNGPLLDPRNLHYVQGLHQDLPSGWTGFWRARSSRMSRSGVRKDRKIRSVKLPTFGLDQSLGEIVGVDEAVGVSGADGRIARGPWGMTPGFGGLT